MKDEPYSDLDLCSLSAVKRSITQTSPASISWVYF